MNIDDLTLGQIKQIQLLMDGDENKDLEHGSLNSMLGKKVIVRTNSAGVFFGELAEKSGKEVIVKNARRMWRWKVAKSISLSAVAIRGIDNSECKITEAVESIWLEAIELIPCTNKAILSIEGVENVKAE